MKTHILKIHPVHFADIKRGVKPWEVRFNDRDFSVGDILILKELKPRVNLPREQDFINPDIFSGNEIMVKVTHIFDDETFLKPNNIIMTIEVVSNDPN